MCTSAQIRSADGVICFFLFSNPYGRKLCQTVKRRKLWQLSNSVGYARNRKTVTRFLYNLKFPATLDDPSAGQLNHCFNGFDFDEALPTPVETEPSLNFVGTGGAAEDDARDRSVKIISLAGGFSLYLFFALSRQDGNDEFLRVGLRRLHFLALWILGI